ncbi:cytochrome-c peroxidase [Bacillus sp. DNRA2]|uniref:cytochrome-c peroxidase n=1 Tax=Bacillus sp. DNRA2 TaxID=2723053 RepID=UPI00145CA1BF|nr:cytochrome c peroxidase [Bacillus sp. DNRA2]NMD71028.1 cytochrome-c peroxidase [Bacillus sp. DNRA2]
MKKIGLMFAALLAIVTLSGCTNKEESKADIDPEKLLQTLKNDSPLVPLGKVPIPADNPMAADVVKLGQILFFDQRLSGANDRSCATCHDPKKGYGDEKATLEMINGKPGARNSPTIINSGYYRSNFWDGRAKSLEEQALGPIQNPNEMNQDLNQLVEELKAVEGYNEYFAAAFPDGITSTNIAKSIAAFERQIVVNDTRFDQFMEGDTDALTQQELRGLDLFAGKAMCSTCHNGPNLSDNNFYNVGLESEDEGLYAITKKAGDMGKFRTAGLYGITHTAPYMHDGSLNTLEDVIDYYNKGGGEHRNKSFYLKNFMSPIGLTDGEKADLLAFLKVLGGEVPIYEAPELPVQ